MKKIYVSPESEVIDFAAEDVVTAVLDIENYSDEGASGNVPGTETGTTSDPEFVNPWA
jgi:hypothetical protein